MHEYAWLALYSGMILLTSMFGGYVPFLWKASHSRLQLYLSLSAGVMLGASFFHVMPDAWDALKDSEIKFGIWMSLGVVGLFCIERFIAPHSHEVNGGRHHHDKEHPHHHEGADHNHAHDHSEAGEHRAAAPAVAGWMAVLGLTIHTFMNGVGLAGQVDKEINLIWPGLTIFLAIALHKPADALAISTVLSRKGVERRKVALVQLGFASMVPIGAAVFTWTKGAIQEDLQGELTGAALAFSAGTFLFIALSDLLPEVQFHRHDRIPLFLALVLGVAAMGGIAVLEHHGHESHGHEPTANGKSDPHNHGHKDHEDDSKDKHHDDD